VKLSAVQPAADTSSQLQTGAVVPCTDLVPSAQPVLCGQGCSLDLY
jgi:hypothetical protein